MKINFTLAILLISILSYAQTFTPKSTGEIVKHNYYSFAYSETHEQPLWVLYELTPSMVNGSTKRTDDFRADPKVSTTSATLTDYKGSGYDRGHLCPAADMKQSHVAMSETFYLSNMSPQNASFNRGIWKSLESTVRSWAISENGVWVVTGAVFKDNIETIGSNDVTVPGYYYKVIYDQTDEKKMIALVLPNKKGEKQLSEYVVTVDQVEELTGIDFFPQLDDQIENKLESISDVELWNFDKVSTSTGTTPTKTYTSTSSEGRCQAKTKSGTQCKRNAAAGSRYCWQHKK